MLEWRAERFDKAERQQDSRRQPQGNERVTYTDNPAALGIGYSRK